MATCDTPETVMGNYRRGLKLINSKKHFGLSHESLLHLHISLFDIDVTLQYVALQLLNIGGTQNLIVARKCTHPFSLLNWVKNFFVESEFMNTLQVFSYNTSVQDIFRQNNQLAIDQFPQLETKK